MMLLCSCLALLEGTLANKASQRFIQILASYTSFRKFTCIVACRATQSFEGKRRQHAAC